MADLTSGRLLPCLDSKAGVETIYLGKWVRDSGVIDLQNEVTFTSPIIFHEYQARDIQVSESLQNSDEGEIYQFSINVDLQKIDKETSKELNVLCDLLLIAVVQFENGNQKVYGFSSGLDVGLNETSGGGKSSFSGYNLTLKGEDEKIPYIIGDGFLFPITDRLKGCNSLITTKSELATQLTVPESNLANVVFDNVNNEIRWHSRNNYSISRVRSFSNTSADTLQQQLSQVIEEFESSKMTSGLERLFAESEIKVLKLTNFVNIVSEGLRGMTKLLQLELPRLENIGNDGLVQNGVSNGNIDILVDFPNIETGLSEIAGGTLTTGNRFVFEDTLEDTLTETNIFPKFWLNTPNIPFDLSRIGGGNVGNNFLRDMLKLSQNINLPQITQLGTFGFSDNFELTSLILTNATTIASAFLRNANSLTYLDIRSCIDLSTNTGNTITGTPNNGTIEANIALQDWLGSGSPHPVIQVLINKNWTVNYY